MNRTWLIFSSCAVAAGIGASFLTDAFSRFPSIMMGFCLGAAIGLVARLMFAEFMFGTYLRKRSRFALFLLFFVLLSGFIGFKTRFVGILP